MWHRGVSKLGMEATLPAYCSYKHSHMNSLSLLLFIPGIKTHISIEVNKWLKACVCVEVRLKNHRPQRDVKQTQCTEKPALRDKTAVHPPSNYHNTSLFNGYIITKCISSTTIMADCDFMQIPWVFNRRSDVIGELQKVWTHCLRSLMQMTPLGAFGPGIKIKTVLMHFKMLVCHIVSGCSNLAQSTSKRVLINRNLCWLCVFFGLTGWVSFFHTHTWEWLINTSLKWPDNVKQWQTPASGCPFIVEFPGQ